MRIPILLLLMFYSAVSQADDTTIYDVDSLKRVFKLKLEANQEKVNVLEDLIENYIAVDLDSALYYSDILKTTLNITGLPECGYYDLLGKIYKEQHNLILFEEQSTKALECFQEQGDDKRIAEAKMELGIAYAYQGKISDATVLFNSSRRLFYELGDSLSAVDCSMHLGSLHMMLNEKADGLEKYFEVYDFYEQKKNYAQLSKLCNNIGIAYSSLEGIIGKQVKKITPDYKENMEKALDYFHRGLSFSEQAQREESFYSEFIKSQLLANIASSYIKLQEYDIALGYLSKGLKLSHEIKSELSIATFNGEIAFAMNKVGKNYEALDAVNKAIPIFKQMNAIDRLVRKLSLKADILRELSQYTSAHMACKECYEASKKTQTLDVQKMALDCISKTSNALKRYKDAYLYQQEYIKVNDSIQILSNKEKLIAQERQNKIEKDKALLEQKNELNILLLKKEKSTSKVYGFMSLLSILGLGLLGTLMLMKGKHTQRIQEKNDLIERANLELSKLNKDLGSANQKLNNFTSVAAHDLKSPLRTISTYSQLLNMRNQDKLEPKDVEMLGFVSTSSKQLSGMIDDLLAFSKIDDDLGPAHEVDISEVLQTVKNNLRATIEEENVKIEAPDNLYKVKAHENLLTQLFQNLIANGIKFRKEDNVSIIKINTEKVTEDNVTYSISDNGIGIEPQYFEKIFTIFKRLNSNENYSGSGIGLATCKSILEHYGQKIWLKSEVNKGTSFYFTLPRS